MILNIVDRVVSRSTSATTSTATKPTNTAINNRQTNNTTTTAKTSHNNERRRSARLQSQGEKHSLVTVSPTNEDATPSKHLRSRTPSSRRVTVTGKSIITISLIITYNIYIIT